MRLIFFLLLLTACSKDSGEIIEIVDDCEGNDPTTKAALLGTWQVDSVVTLFTFEGDSTCSLYSPRRPNCETVRLDDFLFGPALFGADCSIRHHIGPSSPVLWGSYSGLDSTGFDLTLYDSHGGETYRVLSEIVDIGADRIVFAVPLPSGKGFVNKKYVYMSR